MLLIGRVSELRPRSSPLIKFTPVALFVGLAVVAVGMHLMIRSGVEVDPASHLWEGANTWSPTSWEHEQAEKFLSFEESLLSLQDAQWLEQQVSRFDLDSPRQAHELDLAAIRVATNMDVLAAKKRAYKAGEVRKVKEPVYRPIVGDRFALACSKYGELGPLLFKIDKAREPAAYEALQALSELTNMTPK